MIHLEARINYWGGSTHYMTYNYIDFYEWIFIQRNSQAQMAILDSQTTGSLRHLN
jgi:hypothetical protein